MAEEKTLEIARHGTLKIRAGQFALKDTVSLLDATT